jgi:predicted Mrr-cat superfamily restriction endonuclease
MKVYSGTQPEVYAVSGQELRIHWNIKEVPAPSMDDETETQWEANEALCHVNDTRDVLIEKIIGSVHTAGAEIALINNKDIDPDAYAEYQAFRAEAKALADGWVNR